MTATKKDRGRLRHEGMGGFLNPPQHPEHTWCIEIDLRRRPENRGSMSLAAAVECEWLDDATRAAAKRKLAEWDRLPLDHPKVREWIAQVLGYFKGCYRDPSEPEATAWNVDKLVMDKRDPMSSADDHAGVNLIRKYYPEYTPTAEDFQGAYWGTKPS